MVSGGEFVGDPDSRRLRLPPVTSGRAILARQPAQHDPRGAHGIQALDLLRAQGGDGGRQGSRCSPRAHERHHQGDHAPMHEPALADHAQALVNARCKRVGAADQGGVVYRQPDGSTGERDTVSAGVRPHGTGVDLAGRCCRYPLPATIVMRPFIEGKARRHALLLPLRIAQDRRLARRGRQP